MISGRAAFVMVCVAALLVLSTAAYCDGPTLIPGVINKPIPVLQEDCIKFNPDQVEAKQINGNWKVVQGSMWMLDFGGNEAEAKKAVDIIKFYNMDSQCFVGRPDPGMQYYLVGGKAPAGPFQGEDALDFNPSTAEAKKVQGTWKVVDGDHWMMDFGSSEAEAKKAISIIKKYEFNHICYVGRPDAPMMYFRKDKGQKPPVLIPGGVIIPGKLPTPPITVTLVADPKQYHGKYPVTIRFKGTITVDKPCEIQYVFTRSDGATDQVKTLKFKHVGTKNVQDTWTLGKDYEGWETLKILSPVEVESAKAEFTLSQLKQLKPGLIPHQ